MSHLDGNSGIIESSESFGSRRDGRCQFIRTIFGSIFRDVSEEINGFNLVNDCQTNDWQDEQTVVQTVVRLHLLESGSGAEQLTRLWFAFHNEKRANCIIVTSGPSGALGIAGHSRCISQSITMFQVATVIPIAAISKIVCYSEEALTLISVPYIRNSPKRTESERTDIVQARVSLRDFFGKHRLDPTAWRASTVIRQSTTDNH